MAPLRDLQALRTDLANQMKAMRDLLTGDKREFSAEENEKWEKLNKDYDAVCKQIEISLRVDEALRETGDSSGNVGKAGRGDKKAPDDAGERRDHRHDQEDADRDFQLAMSAWVLTHTKPSELAKNTEHYERACRRFGVNPMDKELSIRLSPTTQLFERRQRLFRMRKPDAAYEESRALSTHVGGSIGFTIAPLFNADIESALLYYGPMMQVATPIRTSTAATYPVPTDNETAKTGAYTDENTAVSTGEGVTVNVVNFGAYKATTNAILVPFEAFRDSAINLNGYLSAKLGERLGRFMNAETTTGATKCKGIVTAAAAGITTASSTAIAMDEVLALIHAIDISYRTMPGTGFMFHDQILLALRKLKDGEGRYLWSNGTTASEPDRLWGFPYFVNNNMASTIESGAVTILFGNLPKYHIRTVADIRITMTDQRYWESDQTAFAAYMYFDGNLIDAGTNPVKKLTQV